MDKRPMLATPSTGSSNRAPIDIGDLDGTHWFDLKMDGVRAFAVWDGAKLTLTNRNGENITHRYPELTAAAPGLGYLPTWLDGEIVADNGRFETTLTRDKQNNPASIRMHAEQHPVTFHAFDVPMYHDLPFENRRGTLVSESGNWDLANMTAGHEHPRFRVTPINFSSTFLDRTRELGLEGVIAKRIDSTYQFGARSKSWVKFKNLHRVTCLVVGYEPGTGARAHFGKMNLAVIDNGTLTPCGSVGTGFTQKEIWDLKDRLDRGEVLVVEIECLNVTSGRTLRFPVYKGIRSDLTFNDCLASQLDALPAC